MSQLLQEYGPQLITGILSLVAVGVSVFRAQAQETQASAKAVDELVETSQDSRQRIGQLEEDNRLKDLELETLRQKVAQIPSLLSEIKYLREELNDMRERFKQVITAKNAEIRSLKSRDVLEGDLE